MAQRRKHLYETGKLYTVTDSAQFNACTEYYDSENHDDPLRSLSLDGEITDSTLITSNGVNKKGYATFKMAIGEAWKHAVIVSNIKVTDHPLNVGLVNYKGVEPSRTN